MESADFLIAPGRRSTSSRQPAEQWRKAFNVIRTCHWLSTGILRWSWSPSHAAIDIHNESDTHGSGNGTSKAAAFSLIAADESFKGLVKDRREDCFRRLGGGAGIAAALASDAESGILGDGNDVQRRREAFGGNTYPKPKHKSFWSHVLDALSDVFFVVLLFCAVVSLGFGIKEQDGWYDGVSIFLAVFLVAAVTAVSNHAQAKLFDKLASEPDNTAVTVVRAARRQEVPILDIVVGDVVLLKIGDGVPADGVLLEGHGLQVDESSMTGEPHPVEVDVEKNPFLGSGSKVVDGYGRMLVTAVGTDTAWCEMMSSITTVNTDPTPLQERLEGLTSSIGKIGIAVAVLVFTVLAARQFTGSTKDSQGKPLFVVAIPEGIPLAVTLALAFSVKRMVKEHALVRRLSACETMGSVTAICTDMTGTLTLNQMEVTEFWIGTDQPKATTVIAGSVVSLLRQGVGLNTTRSVHKPDNVSLLEISGSSMEKALLSWAAADLGMDADALKRSCEVVHVEALKSDKKRSGVVIRDTTTGTVVAHWKGAAEMVFANCSMYVDTKGAVRELGVKRRMNLEKVINDMAVAGLRCIAFAYKHVNSEQSTMDDEGLTLLGFVGLKDPCHPEAKSAINTCTKAGVVVKMVTGHDILKARAFAKECGVISSNDPNGIIIEGHEFRAMSKEQQLATVDNIRVMARSLPLDKLALVQRLKEKGHVVAVTGHGANDAPALKEADVGLSMGVQGTEVAKESSDIIILDDNFDTVVTAIRWGRCVYNNIQKFIQFQLTVNAAALIINYVSAIATGKMPLTTVQLLWVSLIMDTMGVLALATEVLMQRPPIGRTAPLISNAMWRNLVAQATFQVAVLLAIQYPGRGAFAGADEKANRTMIFNTFVLCQVFNEFNAREIEKKNVFAGVLKNRMFLAIVAVTLLLQAVTVEVLTRLFGTERLGLRQWGSCVAIAAMSWPIGWAVKFIPVPDRPLHEIFVGNNPNI